MATRRVGSSIETENDGIALTDVESGDGVTNPALDVSSDSGHGPTSSTGPGTGRNPAAGTASGPNHVSAKSPDADVEPEGYVRIKTIAEGAIDTALIAANAGQLKFLFDVGSEAIGVTFIPLIVLLCVSLGAQLIVAVTLVKVFRTNLYKKPKKDELKVEEYNKRMKIWKSADNVKERRRVHWLHDMALLLIVLITAINVVISAFATENKLTSDYVQGFVKEKVGIK